MTVAIVAECYFCPTTLEVDSSAGLSHNELREISMNPDLLEPGWRGFTVDDREVIVFCPRCLVAFATVAAAIEAGIDQVLEQRKAAVA